MSAELETEEEKQHYETYIGFKKFVLYSSICVVLILVLMAVFLL